MSRTRIVALCALLALFSLLLGGGLSAGLAHAQGDGPAPAAAGAAAAVLSPAFTYQGTLTRNGQPVDDTCAFRFGLWDELAGGSIKADLNTFNAVTVKVGTFTVLLNFLNQFTGDERFLQTEVKCPGDADFITLSPRQVLNGVPYAIGLRPGAAMFSAAPGDGFYVEKTAVDSVAIHGRATQPGSIGVFGESASWAGIWGQSAGASGVVGISEGEFNGAVYGENKGRGYGVHGKATQSAGVLGQSTAWFGVYGSSTNQTGVVGESSGHDGVRGTTTAENRVGVRGIANANGSVGVWGESAANTGVYGISNSGTGVWGASTTYVAVYGISDSNTGVRGDSTTETGVYGSGRIGVEGYAANGTSPIGVLGDNNGSNTVGYAGYFDGRVRVTGNLTKGGGAFQIDHPLDPQNKYLSHSFVESPDMKNIYDGVAVLDANGEATVQLPEWFEALNRDFRYQLTGIGGYAPIYIAKEVANNQFQIAGGAPGLKVSWQVTGIRHDPYAEQNRIKVEEEKPAQERGRYLYPAVYGLPVSAGIAALHAGQTTDDTVADDTVADDTVAMPGGRP